MLGLGCFWAWINILQYLRYNKETYIIQHTMRVVAVVIIKYMIGILPVFMAYSFVGVCFFW
jgi:hypothetical protein